MKPREQFLQDYQSKVLNRLPLPPRVGAVQLYGKAAAQLPVLLVEKPQGHAVFLPDGVEAAPQGQQVGLQGAEQPLALVPAVARKARRPSSQKKQVRGRACTSPSLRLNSWACAARSGRSSARQSSIIPPSRHRTRGGW